MSNFDGPMVLDKKSEGDGTTAPGGGSSGQTGTTSTVGVAQATTQADAHESQDDSDDDFFVGGVSAGGGTTTDDAVGSSVSVAGGTSLGSGVGVVGGTSPGSGVSVAGGTSPGSGVSVAGGTSPGSGVGVDVGTSLGGAVPATIVSASGVTVLDKSSGDKVTVTSPSQSTDLFAGTVGLSSQVGSSEMVQVQGAQPQAGEPLVVLEQVPGVGVTQVRPVSDGVPFPGFGTSDHGLPYTGPLQRLERAGPSSRLKPLGPPRGVDLRRGQPAPTGGAGQRLRPLPGSSGILDSTGMVMGTGPQPPEGLGPPLPYMGEPDPKSGGKKPPLPIGVEMQIPVKYPALWRCRSDCGKEPKLPDLPVHREVFLTGYLDRFFPNQWRTNKGLDVSAAVQKANNDAGSGSTVVYPANVTLRVQGIYVKASQKGDNTTLKLPDDAGGKVFYNPDMGVSSKPLPGFLGLKFGLWGRGSPIFIIATDELSISGFIFDGNRDMLHKPIAWNSRRGPMLYSLIQAPILFTRMLVEHNTFQNAQYTAMYLRDMTGEVQWTGSPSGKYKGKFKNIYGDDRPCLRGQWPSSNTRAPTVSEIESVVIRHNTFQDIQNHGLMISNSSAPKAKKGSSKTTGESGSVLSFSGSLVFSHNRSMDSGTPGVWMKVGNNLWEEHNMGDLLIVTRFRDLSICHNETVRTARFDYKIGPCNNYVMDCNESVDAGWGMFELGCQTLDLKANLLGGTMRIRSNRFTRKTARPILMRREETGNSRPTPFVRPISFVYLKGSGGGYDGDENEKANPAYWQDILVEHNRILGGDGWIVDGVHADPRTRVNKLVVKDNIFDSLYRAAVYITLPDKIFKKDSKEPQPVLSKLHVQGNVVSSIKSNRNTNNGLMYITGAGTPIGKLAIWKNNVFSTESGIRALADSAVELIIEGNQFLAIPTYSLAFPNCLSVKKYSIINNLFVKKILINGELMKGTILNCGLVFCNPPNSTMTPNFEWEPPSLKTKEIILKNTKVKCVIKGYPQHSCMAKKI